MYVAHFEVKKRKPELLKFEVSTREPRVLEFKAVKKTPIKFKVGQDMTVDVVEN